MSDPASPNGDNNGAEEELLPLCGNNDENNNNNNNFQHNNGSIPTNDEMEKLYASLVEPIISNTNDNDDDDASTPLPLNKNQVEDTTTNYNNNNNDSQQAADRITPPPPTTTAINSGTSAAASLPPPVASSSVPSTSSETEQTSKPSVTPVNNAAIDIEILDIDDKPDNVITTNNNNPSPPPIKTSLEKNITAAQQQQQQQQQPLPPAQQTHNQPETIELLSSSDEDDTTTNRKRKQLMSVKPSMPLPSASHRYQQQQQQQQQQNHGQYNNTQAVSQQRAGTAPPQSSHVPVVVYQELQSGLIRVEESVCSVCSKSVRQPAAAASQTSPNAFNSQSNKQPFYTCDNCGETIHNYCANQVSTGANKWRCVQSVYPPMYKPVVRARPQHPPDFRGTNGSMIEWTEHTIDLIRQPTSTIQQQQPLVVETNHTNGVAPSQQRQRQRLPSLGIEVQHTEDMEKHMICLLGDNEMLSRINDKQLSTLCPLSINVKGMMIVGVFDGLAASLAGIRQSDVVTAVEFSNSNDKMMAVLEDENNVGNALEQHHDLTTMTPAERTKLLRQPLPHLRFKIQRPNHNLVYVAQNWLRFMHTVNDAQNRMWKPEFEKTPPRWLWWCPVCANPPVDNDTENISEFDI